jgi:hypothetical protein
MNTAILKFELTVAEVNIVLATLSKHPFEQVADLITKIQSQGNPQLAELEKAAAEAAPAAE